MSLHGSPSPLPSPPQDNYQQGQQYQSILNLHGSTTTMDAHQSTSNPPSFPVYQRPIPHIDQQFPMLIASATFAPQTAEAPMYPYFFPGFTDPGFSETFEQSNPHLSHWAPYQDPLRGGTPAGPESRTEQPTHFSNTFLLLRGYNGEQNEYGKFDCFEYCDRRRYEERGFQRRSNLLTHLRSCHRQDIPRNDHVRDHNKDRHSRKLGRASRKAIK